MPISVNRSLLPSPIKHSFERGETDFICEFQAQNTLETVLRFAKANLCPSRISASNSCGKGFQLIGIRVYLQEAKNL